MSFETYVTKLRKKHAELSGLVDIEQKRPNPDNLAVTGLKKKKLYIKQEISKILKNK